MKDEHATNPIVEMCSLRSKMYSVRTVNEHDKLRAKGLKQCLLNRLTFTDYTQSMRDVSCTKHKFKQIRSKHHYLATIKQNKIRLSPFDDKRFVLSCGVHTLAYGYYKIARDRGCCSLCMS